MSFIPPAGTTYTVDLYRYVETWKAVAEEVDALAPEFEPYVEAIRAVRLRKAENTHREEFNRHVQKLEWMYQDEIDHGACWSVTYNREHMYECHPHGRTVEEINERWPHYHPKEEYYASTAAEAYGRLRTLIGDAVAACINLPDGVVTLTPAMAKHYGQACSGDILRQAQRALHSYISEAKGELPPLVSLYAPRVRPKREPLPKKVVAPANSSHHEEEPEDRGALMFMGAIITSVLVYMIYKGMTS